MRIPLEKWGSRPLRTATTVQSLSKENIQELFARSLEGAYDDREPWEAVRILHHLGIPEVLDIAAQWCEAADGLQRARGADVIAQLGKTVEHPSNSFPAESFSVISRMLEKETEIRSLSSAIFALGHLNNPSAISLVRKYEAHSSAEVRYAVAFAFGSQPNDPEAIEELVKLTLDLDGDVRDWATFGLGVLGDGDMVRIREVLVARLSDTNRDAPEEAGSLMLGMDQEGPQMPARDYVAALNERFS